MPPPPLPPPTLAKPDSTDKPKRNRHGQLMTEIADSYPQEKAASSREQQEHACSLAPIQKEKEQTSTAPPQQQVENDQQLLKIATSMSLKQIKQKFPHGTDPSRRRRLIDLHLQAMVANQNGDELMQNVKTEQHLLELAASMTNKEIRNTFKSKRNRGIRRKLYELKRGGSIQTKKAASGSKKRKKLAKTKPAWKEDKNKKQRKDLLKEDDSDDGDYVEHDDGEDA